MAKYDEGFLTAALLGYESEKAKIDEAIAQIRAQLGHRSPGSLITASDGTGQAGPRRRTMSASARERIAAAQRKRWAALKRIQAGQEKPKAKRKLSAAGRKAIIAATKKRWAAVRAAKSKAAAKPKARKAAAKPKKTATQETAAAAAS